MEAALPALRLLARRSRLARRNVGQYRSIVVCSADRIATVEAVRAEVESTVTGGEAVMTEVLVDVPFYEAEEYHQQYYEKGREMVREVRRQCGLPEQP